MLYLLTSNSKYFRKLSSKLIKSSKNANESCWEPSI